jgi:SAM-dependent methyltransferase
MSLSCSSCGQSYAHSSGIWRFLPEPRLGTYSRFLNEYQLVRSHEGWGSKDPGYYRHLPHVGAGDPQRDIWELRARAFRALIERIVRPRERFHSATMKILDLGAGNCWLAYRLAKRGHHVAAVDLWVDDLDGLGAHVHYEIGSPALTPVQAEFDRLPFAGDQADLAVFNGSLHYSTDYVATVQEAMRVLRPDGLLVIMDSPVYCDPGSGLQMVREREERFECLHGFPGNALACESFLTWTRLDQVAAELGVSWQTVVRSSDRIWRLRRWKARIRGHREPAHFPLIVGALRA